MRVLFLDDDPGRHSDFRMGSIGHDVVFVETYAEAVHMLQNQGKFDDVWLDHDLSEEMAEGRGRYGEKTGYDVACVVASLPIELRPARVVVHSLNAPGGERMMSALRSGGVNCVRYPFSMFRAALGK